MAISERHPALSDQKRLWFLVQQDKTNPAYNLQLSYHLKGVINYDVFNKSLVKLFERQFSMFSVLRQQAGVPYIEIIRRIVKTEFIDFSDFPFEKREEKILDFAGEDLRKCFNVEEGPLYRLYLLKESDESFFFVATIHHLIFDGWSRRIFVKELSNIYSDLIRGVDVTPDRHAFSCFDYAESNEAALSSVEEKDLKNFWRKSLKDCPSTLKFPFDFPCRENHSGLGWREPFAISKECAESLKTISREENISLFNTVLVLLGLLLQKYTGENDICIGVPVNHRKMHPSLNETFGLFVNTVVVRLNIKEGKSLREHLRKSKQIVRQSIAHSRLPFEKIVEAVNPDRNKGVNPLFQVSLSWMNDMTINMDLGGVTGEKVTVNKGISPFDFTFYMWEADDTILGEIEYSTDLLKRETVIRLKDNFLTLIKSATENSEGNADFLSAVSERELNQIKSFCGIRSDYPKDKTITQLFEEQVKLYPDNKALVFKGESYTYCQLDEKSNRLAATLTSAGAGVNTPIGILADKSILTITAILGVLKSGSGYVPIDPDLPLPRIRFILKDSGCKIVVTQDEYVNFLEDGVTVINLDDNRVFSDLKPGPEISRNSSDLAYIMYTSGTTGTPKGAMIHNYSVVRLVRNTNYLNLSSHDRVLLTGAIGFDATTFEIWGALLNGGTLYLADKEVILDPRALGRELKDNDITTLWLTSSLFTQIAESGTDIFSNLKYLLVGGDVLSVTHINRVRKNNPELKVINGYGPTENTTFSTTYLIEKDFEHNIPIGKPISNSTAYIFDKDMHFQPIGVKGELYVGGDGVSKGYLNRDELNRKSFVTNPYMPEERLYRTGDFARWLDDGNIEFIGRIDNQLKIRGYRVELEDIESAILEIEGVSEVVVKPVKIKEGDIRLAAFLNVSNDFAIDEQTMGMTLRKVLPNYMVPDVFKVVNGFPRTINGKIDKNALTVDLNDFEKHELTVQTTLTETERVLHDIWCRYLKRRTILITDNFFEIGGNSILAIAVFSAIESAFNLELGLRVFFDSPRIIDLAKAIDFKKMNGIDSSTKEIKTNTGSGNVKGEI